MEGLVHGNVTEPEVLKQEPLEAEKAKNISEDNAGNGTNQLDDNPSQETQGKSVSSAYVDLNS